MGWSSGSRLFNDLISVLQSEIQDETKRKAIYTKLIQVFEERDWDTQDECLGEDPAYDAALMELHPDWYGPDT